MNQPFFPFTPDALLPAPKHACPKCASENLTAHFDCEKQLGVCSYCHNTQMVIPVDILCQHLRALVEAEYNDPLNVLGWVDGEWVGEVIGSYDIVTRFYSGSSNVLAQELINELGDQQWCKRQECHEEPA